MVSGTFQVWWGSPSRDLEDANGGWWGVGYVESFKNWEKADLRNLSVVTNLKYLEIWSKEWRNWEIGVAIGGGVLEIWVIWEI